MKKERKKGTDSWDGEGERQERVNHSAVVNMNTQRDRDSKLTGAFYIGVK